MPDLDTPRIFLRLYRLYRANGHGRRASWKLAHLTIKHRL